MPPPKTISTSKLPGRRKLYLDLLYDPDRTGLFFSWPHPTPAAFDACARHLDTQEFDRQSIRDILVRQNRSYGAPPAAIAAAEEVASSSALTVFTGQQSGLFGGPLYTVYKALTLIGWAAKLRELLQRPVVPVFWIAADDHDFEEVRWTGFPDLENRVRRLSLPDHKHGDRTPVSQVLLDEHIGDLLSEMQKEQLVTEFSAGVFRALAEDFKSGRSLVDAFAHWMARLLGPFGLVMFNPVDPASKALWRPLVKRELEGHAGTAAALAEMNQRLVEAGYHRQVEHPDRHTHLFYVHQGRHAIKTTSDGHLMTDPEGTSHTREEWLLRLEKEPEAFSPGVLLRPIAQSYLFPVLATVCGPSEIAYWAQSRALFDRFDVLMPVVLHRSSATIVETKNRNAAAALGHDLSEFFGDIEALINRHFESSFPHDIEQRFGAERQEWNDRLDRLKSLVVGFEPTLDKTFELSAGKIALAWENLEKKVFQAHKRKGDEIRAKFYKLEAHLCPEGVPQERVFGITYYLNKYGFDFLSRVKDQLKIGTPDHQIIEP